MKNYGVLGSSMLNEARHTPGLSPLAPYNMGHNPRNPASLLGRAIGNPFGPPPVRGREIAHFLLGQGSQEPIFAPRPRP